MDEVLDLGVPVFVEKPLTTDPERATALADRAPERLFVMDKWRYHPAVRAVRDIAATGEIGAVAGLATRREARGTGHVDVDPVWILAPHDLAAGVEILGHLPPARSATLELVGGRVVGMQATLGEGPWLTLSVSGAAPAYHRSMRLLCEGGIAWLDDGWADHVLVARADAIGRDPERRPAEGELPLLAELRAVVGHLNGGPPPLSDARTGARTVRRIAELRGMGGAEADGSA